MMLDNNEILRFSFYNIEVYENFKKYVKFFKEIEQNFDIEEILPDHKIESWKEEYTRKCEKLTNLDQNKYLSLSKSHDFLFDNLKPSFINKVLLKLFLEKESNETIVKNLKTFYPNRKGIAKHIEYDRNNNVSGRLVVKKGPSILTLPSRCRSIISSRFDNGEILSADFISLEPRVCLKMSNKKEVNDIYEDIRQKMSFEIDRSVAKRSTISVLYGKRYIDGFSKERSDEIYNTIHEYFNLDKVLEKSKNIDSFSIRRNIMGKPIWNLQEERPHLLINNYIQSSAVDISLTYFSSILKSLDLKKAVPIFIVHDSIVFDIEKDYKEEFKKVVSKGYYNDNLGYFPLKIETFNRSK